MPYVEFKPRPDLAHIVKCVWNYDAAADDTAERPERIVPDGNPELVIHYGDPFAEIAPDGGKRLQPRAFVMGQITRPLALDACHGVAGVLGVRFHPAGVRALIGAAMDEFTNGRIEVSNFAPSRAKGLVDEIASAADAPARAEIIQNFVTDRAARSTRYQDTDVDRWAARIACANGRLTVTELAGEASLSTRQLERRFRTQVGIAPRDYANIIRFRSVFDLLTGGAKADWAKLAAEAGYFDQSHLNRDFRRFLGCSPTAFVTQLRGLTAVLVGADEDTACRVVTRRAGAG
ncbi:MAG: AraC family transcriptional regulator [Alphaproteobacteria bacterium]|nr:AraC family transcriptional regulator [Alphaproteobacteria bacterium]